MKDETMKNKILVVLALVSVLFLGMQVFASQEQKGVLVVYNRPLDLNTIISCPHILADDKETTQKFVEEGGAGTVFYPVFFMSKRTYEGVKSDCLDISFHELWSCQGIKRYCPKFLPSHLFVDAHGSCKKRIEFENCLSVNNIPMKKFDIVLKEFKSWELFYFTSWCAVIAFCAYAFYKNPSTLNYFINKTN